jgi:restriction system protein
MKGWIFGNPDQKTWTQKIYKHSTKFQNPLHQNYKHTKTLESLLGLNDQQVHSLVVFVGDSTFKTEMPENVTYGFGYVRYIKSKRQNVLSEAEVDAILNKIGAGMLTRSFKTNREHIKHVNHIVSEKKKENTCPKCGGPMLLRETKNGQNAGKQFWGCSKFPKCKGILNVT